MTAAAVGCLAAAEPTVGTALERSLTLAECTLLAVRNNRDLGAGPLAQPLSLEGAETLSARLPTSTSPCTATLLTGCAFQ